MDVNKHGVTRNIPESVKREVRQRCGFGCVKCGCAIYQYDHLDPSFYDAKEHDPACIILLCAGCHFEKTRGLLSLETVKRHAAMPKCIQLGYSFGPFDIGINMPIITIGSLCFVNVKTLFKIEDDEILKISPPTLQGTPFLLNAFLSDREGKEIFRIVQNEWRSSSENWDVESIGRKIIIRKRKGDILLTIRSDPPNHLVIEKIDMEHKGTRIIARENQEFEIYTSAGSKVQGLNAHMEISGTESQQGIEINNGRLQICGNVRISGNLNNANIAASRNSLCLCGSRTRYKHCCGKPSSDNKMLYDKSSYIPKINKNYCSVAISYGNIDKPIASKIYQFLINNGVQTWFYPESSVPGEKLHRMMSNMINDADRVLLLCSQTSLERDAVLNEIERVLEREGKEGGSNLLIPIALDDYVFEKWMPERLDLARQIRSRNFLRLNDDFKSEDTKKALEKLLQALSLERI